MKKIIFFISALIYISGCKSDNTMAPRSDRQPVSKIIPYYQIGNKIASTDTVAGAMVAEAITTQSPVGGNIQTVSSWTDYSTTVAFFDQSWNQTHPGSAQLNGMSIPDHGNFNFTYDTTEFGVKHHWNITANTSGSVPAITDSLQSPNLFHVTFPRYPTLDTISKSSGFTCTFGNPGTDSVILLIDYDSAVTVGLYDSSIHHSMAKVYLTIANTGSYFVSSSLLSSLPSSGVIQVHIIAVRSKKVTISGRVYMIASTSRARAYCFIKS